MSVSTSISLPGSVQAREVAIVIGAALGFPLRREKLGGGGSYTECREVDLICSGQPGLALVRVPSFKIGRESFRGQSFLYHYEWESGPEKGKGRGMLPNSNPLAIMIGRRLVSFFGGSLIYQDGNYDTPDFAVPEAPDLLHEDDPEWTAFQERLFSVQPITPAELNAAKEWAAYPD